MVAVPHSDLRGDILRVIEAVAAPMKSSAISRALSAAARPKPGSLPGMLAGMVAEGLILEIPGRTPRYARAPATRWVEAMVIAQLADGGVTREDRLARLLAPHQGLLAGVIARLRKEGRVHAHPPVRAGGPVSYGATPPDPLTYIGRELDRLIADARAKGFTPAALRIAVLSRLAEEEGALSDPPPVIEAIRRLAPGADQGGAVSIVSLRKELAPAHDRAAVDREILALARRSMLVLHSHPWPALLSSGERSVLIEDGRGGWFDGVALHRASG